MARSTFEDAEDASEDPEPIMVTEAEADAALTAILDQNIGIGASVWDNKLEHRCDRCLGVPSPPAHWA